MCLLLAAVRVVPGSPLVLLANRDEYHDRPSEAPRARAGGVVCGLDLRAGGTWLGRNADGVVAALTNRPGGADPSRPSRGAMPFEALLARSAAEAAERAAVRAASDRPNPFSLLVADRREAFAVLHDERPRVVPLAPGLRTLTNLHDLDGLGAATVLAAAGLAEEDLRGATSAERALDVLRRAAPSHRPLDGTRTAACVHGDGRGTVSSSILVLGDDPASDVYLHAPGPPCRTAYGEVPLPGRGAAS